MSAARQRKRKSVSHTANLNPRQLTGSYIAKIALTSHCTTLMLFLLVWAWSQVAMPRKSVVDICTSLSSPRLNICLHKHKHISAYLSVVPNETIKRVATEHNVHNNHSVSLCVCSLF